MTAADLLASLIETTAASTAALLLVLLLRAPVRALFGARVVYALWTLLPLSLLAVSLPAPVRDALLPVSVLTMPYMLASAVTVGSAQPLDAVAGTAVSQWPWPLLLWIGGAVASAALFARQQRRFVRELGRVVRGDDGLLRAERSAGCPAVIGAWSPRIVLPADFDARYPAHEGELVLAHERVHLAHGDTRINLLAVALRCAYWFNPLLHWSSAKFRDDQELACDAVVLAHHPHSRRAYAGAMLKTQLAVLGLPVGCHWQSSQSLKERILMLKTPQPGAWRRRGGIAAVAAVLTAGSYGAWALQPAAAVQAPMFLGTEMHGTVIYADVVATTDKQALFITSGGMGNGPNGATRVYMPDEGALFLGFGSRDPEKALHLTAVASGSAQSPHLRWKLERDKRLVDDGEFPLDATKPVDLVLGGDRHGIREFAKLRFAAASGLLTGQFDQPGPRLLRGADDVFVSPQSGAIYGDAFKSSGSAILMLQVSERGDVTDATVESSTPAGAFTDVDARRFVDGWKYAPMRRDGKNMSSRIRASIDFGPTPPKNPPQVDSDVEFTASTPAPPYPADALANKLPGRVLLHLLVATDGSVKNVRVVDSDPSGVFDAVSVEAARKWKMAPEIKDGRPIEAWMQVPITFSPNGPPEAPPAEPESA